MSRWIQELGSAVQMALHPLVKRRQWPHAISSTEERTCKEHLAGLEFTAPLPLNITSAVAGDYAGLAAQDTTPETVLGIVPVGFPGLNVLQQNMDAAAAAQVPPTPNAKLQ